MEIDFESKLLALGLGQDITLSLLNHFEFLSQSCPIMYVAGPVSADGDEKIEENIAKLKAYCEKLRKKYRMFLPLRIL